MILYAACLGCICAAVLTAVAQLTEPLRKANEEAEKMRNILSVFEISYPQKATHEQLKEIYQANVIAPKKTDGLKLYRYAPARAEADRRLVKAVAVEFAGPGLWAPIKGFLALDPKIRTIRGITFYEQKETPTLGGRIERKSFRSGFVGKSVRSAEGPPGIRIVKEGTAKGPNEIDGISGATTTCRRVEAMVNKAISRIVKEHGSGE